MFDQLEYDRNIRRCRQIQYNYSDIYLLVCSRYYLIFHPPFVSSLDCTLFCFVMSHKPCVQLITIVKLFLTRSVYKICIHTYTPNKAELFKCIIYFSLYSINSSYKYRRSCNIVFNSLTQQINQSTQMLHKLYSFLFNRSQQCYTILFLYIYTPHKYYKARRSSLAK